MGDDRPSVYMEDGVTVFRASALGHCERALVAGARGLAPIPYPDFMYDRFEEGNRAEPTILEWFYQEHPGYVPELDARQAEWDYEVDDSTVIRCHLDDLARNASGTLVVEGKALGPDLYERVVKNGAEGLLPAYQWQVAVYMHVTKSSRAVVVCARKDDTGNVSLASDFHCVWFNHPPYSQTQIRTRIANILEWVDKEGWPAGCPADFICEYPYLHDDKQWVDVQGDDRELVDHAAGLYLEGAELEKQGKAKKKEASRILKQWVDRIREYVGGDTGPADSEHLRVQTPGVKLTWIEEDVPERTSTTKAYTKTYPKISKREKEQ